MKRFRHINDRTLFQASLVLALIGSWFSVGFFHPDEQYYAVDFAAHKMGWLDEIQTWEHRTQIRPWLLPTIFIPFLSVAKALGFSPFLGAWILRLISALLGWWSLCQLNRQLKPYFHQKFFYLFFIFMSHFSFFCFFMRLRTTSENWSTSLFILGLASLLKKNINLKEILLGGFCFGLAFSLRHQLGIMVLGFGLWLLLFKREPIKRWLLAFAPSILAGAGVGLLADFYGYQESTLTPWNYIYHNLFLDKISQFGVSPFHAYFEWAIKDLHLWGIILIIGLASTLRHPGGWVAWTTLPFLLIHLFIGHKELRFLFPLSYPLLFQCTLFFQSKNWKNAFATNTLITINGLFLLFILFKPAHTPIGFYRYLYSNDIKHVYIFEEPDNTRPDLDMNFYKKPHLRVQVYPKNKDGSTMNGFFFTTKYRDLSRFQNQNCRRLYSSYPSWMFHLNFTNWIERSNMWVLTECKKW